jgi:putative tryptophan/tyrosine transport system substrate-binding protein
VLMRRREVVASLGAAALWPLAARAQQRVVSIGVLHGVSAAQWKDRMVGFHRGLGEGGFSEGHNLRIEYRWAEGHFERLPTLAADLVSRNVAAICAGASDVAIRAAMEATKTIPIVFTTASDPVRAGFVHALHRPGWKRHGGDLYGS